MGSVSVWPKLSWSLSACSLSLCLSLSLYCSLPLSRSLSPAPSLPLPVHHSHLSLFPGVPRLTAVEPLNIFVFDCFVWEAARRSQRNRSRDRLSVSVVSLAPPA